MVSVVLSLFPSFNGTMADKGSAEPNVALLSPNVGGSPDFGASSLDVLGGEFSELSPSRSGADDMRKRKAPERELEEESEPSEARFKNVKRGESDEAAVTQAEAAVTQAVEQDYVMFDPFEQKQVGPAMTPEQTAFVERNFTAYIPNEVVLDKILEDCPKPTIKLLEPPKLDASLLALLNSDSLKPAKFSDKTFARLQMKTADVLGPLGALWTKLDDVRRGGEEEVDISELLRMAEKSVMLVGQIFVYATHQRRHGILTRILKEPSSATETLKEAETELTEGIWQGALFGEEFQKLLHLKAKGNKELKEIKQELGRPEPRFRPMPQQPFRHGAPRGARGSRRGFVARVRGRGFQTGRGRPTGRGLPSSAGASRPGGDRKRWVRAVAFSTKSIKGSCSNISSKLVKVKSRSRPCRLGAVPPTLSSPQRVVKLKSHSVQGRTSPSGAKNCKIQGKLEEDYLRPTYSEHGGGFEGGVYRHPNSVDRTTVAKFLSGAGEQATGRDRENVGKRGDQVSDTRKGPVSEPSFPQAKERRGSEASVQLEESKCISEIRTLQDGRNTNVSKHPGERRLDDEGGPERRVFLCSVVRDTEKALQVQMERPVVRISGAPFRAGFSTESVYKITEASDEHTEAHGTQDHNFPGRSVHLQQMQVRNSEGQGHSSVAVPDLRVCDKLEQVVFDTDKDIGIFGADHRFPENVTVAPDRESPRNQRALQSAPQEKNDHGARVGSISRKDDCYSKGGSPSSAPLQTFTDGEDESTSERGPKLRDATVTLRGGSEGVVMVDRFTGAGERQENDSAKSRCSYNHGCVQKRLGSGVPRGDHTGLMEHTGSPQAHKLPGVNGSKVCHHGICKRPEGPPYSCQIGQQGNSSPDKQNGGCPVSGPVQGDQRAVVICSQERDHSYCRPPARRPESGGGQGAENIFGLQCLETGSMGVQGTGGQMGSIRGRHVCRSIEQAEGDLLQLETRPTGGSNRCLYDAMGNSAGVHVPTFLPNRQMPGKDKEGGSQGSSGSTDLAGTAMVSSAVNNVGGATGFASTSQEIVRVPKGVATSTAGDSLMLAAWKVSGKEADSKDFQRGQPHWSQKHGGQVQSALITPPGTSGLAGVVRGKLIHFRPLWDR